MGVLTLCRILLSLFSGFNLFSYIFIVVCIIRHPSLQTITNYTLFSTGVAHIVFQFMCLISIFKQDVCSFDNPLTILAFFYIGMVAVFANTVLVTIETYLKVCHPFLYARVITDRKCFLLIALIWAISFCSGAIAGKAGIGLEHGSNNESCPFVGVIVNHGKTLGIILNITLLPSLVIISVLKFLVIRTAREHAGRIGALGAREPPQKQQQPNGDIVEQLQRKFKNIRKSTINLAIFVGTYFCGWVPFLIISNINFYTGNPVGSNATLITFGVVANLTSVGPLVYTLRQTEFSRLQKRYVQRIKAYVCGHLGDIRKKVQVNVIQSKPRTTETEFGASVPQ